MIYRVFIGVFAVCNPGIHAIAHVTVRDDLRHEWAHVLPEPLSTPNAWAEATRLAMHRVRRPDASVVIAVRDKHLPGVCSLVTPPNVSVVWIPRKEGNPEMERAHTLARLRFVATIVSTKAV